MEDPAQSFDALLSVKQQVSALCLCGIKSLGTFHLGVTDLLAGTRVDPLEFKGFTNLHDSLNSAHVTATEASIASTASCIRALYLYPAFTSRDTIDFSPLLEQMERRFKDGELKSSGLKHCNPFTVGVLLPALKQIGARPDSELVLGCIRALKKDAAKPGVSIDGYPPNGYLTYWALRSLDAWSELDDEAQPSLDWSTREFQEQINLFTSRDEESDAYQLGYNLLIQERFSKHPPRASIRDLGLQTLFSAQLDRGVWEKKDPLFVYGNYGDAYGFTFELLATLLHEYSRYPDVLAPYEPQLEKAFGWIQRNVMRTDVPESRIAVWRSGNRVDDRRPESWATAEIYSFLRFYEGHLSSRIQTIVQRNLSHGLPSGQPNPEAFSSLYLPVVVLPNRKGEVFKLDSLLKEKVLDPLRVHNDPLTYSLVRSTHPEHTYRSGILFGPPRTGKTSLVKEVARYLGWPLIILDPSDFVKDGLPLIHSVTSRIFKQLEELEDCVIFFDEMEELMRRRDAQYLNSFEQRVLTTSLLPKWQELHDRAQCLFFVATNYLDVIDEAAKGPGRFDFWLQVLPPSIDEKRRMIEESIQSASVRTQLLHDLESIENKLTWATTLEMRRLINELERPGSDVTAVLLKFEPRLIRDDNERKKVEDEMHNNSF